MEKVCNEVLVQGEKLCTSRKLRKVVAIYKTNKLVLSKRYISSKTRDPEIVPYSNSSRSRLIFCKYSLFLVSLRAVIHIEERTLIPSPCVQLLLNSRNPTHIADLQRSFISWCLLKNELSLSDFYFHRTVCRQKKSI